MKLPSITDALADARTTFARFPFVLLDAIIGTACGLILIDHEGPPAPTVLFPIIFAAVLGLPLLLGLALLSQKKKWGRPLALALQIAGVIVAAGYGASVPTDLPRAPDSHLFRLAMLTASLVFFACAVPYFRHANERGYWNFCKTIILRLLVSFLYTVVLWVGLAIALAALDNLFGVDVPGRRYGELWVLINGVFLTWFFLAGIPHDLNQLDSEADYPKGLKIFSQYILYPLVLVYLVILYAYLGKIIIAWEWPEGWVSKLILGFIATGISSLLLLHPVREQAENVWIRFSSRWFYVIIIPLLIMLFLAVWRRVSEYGITEGRYLAIATGMWLCVVAPYYIVSRKKSIRFMPLSMFLVTLTVSFGPWGMFAVSENSQVARLKELLAKNHILVNEQIQSKHDSIQFDATKQISSILTYLSEVHGLDAIQPWFGESLKSGLEEGTSTYRDAASVAKLMGIQYVRVWQTAAGGTSVLTVDRDAALDLAGYDHLLRSQHGYSGVLSKEFPDHGLTYRVGKDLDKITITVARGTSVPDTLQFDLLPLVRNLMSDYGNASTDKIPVERMTITGATTSARMKLWFTNIRLVRSRGETKVVSFESDLAYSILPQK